MRLARWLVVLPILLASPIDAEAACKADTRSFTYTDKVTKNSIEMRATNSAQTLIFKTSDGKTIGGSGARLKLDDNRVSGSFTSRTGTILVTGNPRQGRVMASAVLRTALEKPIRVSKRKIITSIRTTYTLATGSGPKLEVHCGG